MGERKETVPIIIHLELKFYQMDGESIFTIEDQKTRLILLIKYKHSSDRYSLYTTPITLLETLEGYDSTQFQAWLDEYLETLTRPSLIFI